MLVPPQRFLGNLLQPNALNAAGRAREILVDELRVQPHGFEDLRAAVTLLRRDAHFRHHFQHALHRRFDEVLLQLLVREFAGQIPLGSHVVQRGQRQIWIHRPDAV